MQQTQVADGRTRRKINTMRAVQAAALRLFETRGYDAVSVEEVALAANVGPASVYRNFGTKENLVSWDEYDPLVFEAVRHQLGRSKPLAAIRDGLISALGQVYENDARRILVRARLIQRTPALQASSLAGLHAMRAGLFEVLKPAVRSPRQRALLCAVVVSALDVAIVNWVGSGGTKPLAAELRRTFELLESLGRVG